MDNARKQTNKQLKKMEKYLRKMYSTSLEEIQEKWDLFMHEMEKRISDIDEKIKYAVMQNDKKEIEHLEYERKRLMQNMTLGDKHYKEMVRQTSERISKVNEDALAYINGKIPKIYTINYNQFATDSKYVKGYQFELIDEYTVKYMIDNDVDFMPKKVIDRHRDIAWNKKMINSQVMQGILQGESIAKISKRLENVVGMNKNSAIRNARTMTTNAECGGRQESYRKAVSDGIIMKKTWIATKGARTKPRDWHADLNGKTVEVDEYFENEYGKIMFPGDPQSHPCNRYNCRCSIKSKIIGFRKGGKINYV